MLSCPGKHGTAHRTGHLTYNIAGRHNALDIDFGRTAADYRRHRAGFPPALLERLAAFGVGQAGQRLLDLGTGTGSLGRLFARRGCSAVGLDPSEPLLAQARELDREAGVAVTYRVGRAEATGFEDAAFDVVTAGQCWHWFDRPAASREALRILRPGGRIVIAHYDWLPLPGNVVEATEALILRHNPAWRGAGGHGVYPRWFGDLSGAGFGALESFSFDRPEPYTHEGWRGRIRASAGVAASLDAEQVARCDAELAALLRERFPAEPLQIPHRVFALIGTRPA